MALRIGDLITLALNRPSMKDLLHRNDIDIDAYITKLNASNEANVCVSSYQEFEARYDHLLHALSSILELRDLRVLDVHRGFVKALVLDIFERLI